MPIYAYRCRSCNASFEELVRMSTRPEQVPCPACGRRDCERRLSASAGGTSARTARGSSASAGCGTSGFR